MRRLEWPCSPEDYSELLRALHSGAVLGHPSSGLYGLGAAANDRGLAGLRRVKDRDPPQAFLMLITESLATGGWFCLGDLGAALAQEYWPGALTLIVEPDSACPEALLGLHGGVALRWDGHPIPERIVSDLALPLLSTSANRPGEPPQAEALPEAWPDGVWGWIDAKAGGAGPSTLVDVRGDRPQLLRKGAVSLDLKHWGLDDRSSSDLAGPNGS